METPLWSVDLGDKKRVSGIVILTWQTKNQEHRTTQKENVYNLDRLVVYVDSKERPPAAGDEQQQCGSVTRQNEAVMKPRIHVQCVRPLEGRYVHIQAWGVPNRRNRLFSAVLCEVMVYAWYGNDAMCWPFRGVQRLFLQLVLFQSDFESDWNLSRFAQFILCS